MTTRMRREKAERERTFRDTLKALRELSKRRAEELRKAVESIPDDVWNAAVEKENQNAPRP